VPITKELPPNFPALTLSVMRAVCVIERQDAEAGRGNERLVKVLDALFAKYWVECVATHEPEKLQAVLKDVLGEADTEQGTLLIFPSLQNLLIVWGGRHLRRVSSQSHLVSRRSDGGYRT
jgi:hypothetical protein